ncbi:hypothetical protein GGR50DRAFT_171874 [Xylaria sp. CBS 124048]|nr:hypothetical protein GGR50DRAFT_171874 [Xylaria sp. CBS 124048]
MLAATSHSTVSFFLPLRIDGLHLCSGCPIKSAPSGTYARSSVQYKDNTRGIPKSGKPRCCVDGKSPNLGIVVDELRSCTKLQTFELATQECRPRPCWLAHRAELPCGQPFSAYLPLR